MQSGVLWAFLAESAEHGVSDIGKRGVHFRTGLEATFRSTYRGQIKVSRRKDSMSQWESENGVMP